MQYIEGLEGKEIEDLDDEDLGKFSIPFTLQRKDINDFKEFCDKNQILFKDYRFKS